MKEQTFVKETYSSVNTILHVGQVVECVYYREDIQYPMRFLWGFTPVKIGVIIGDAGIRPYYLAFDENGLEQYLYVKFKEYFFKKAIPISCIQDINQATKTMEILLNNSKHKIGQEGYSAESFNKLTTQLNRAKAFSQ